MIDFIAIHKLLLATILGALIGLERDIHGRAAGTRTHLLVSCGAALFMLMNNSIPEASGRIAAQIVLGIGFLGAGTILKEGFTIKGLTTAACLWVAAGVGMATGNGNIDLALTVTGITLFTLLVLQHLEKFIRKDEFRTISVSFPVEQDVHPIINILKKNKVRIINYDYIKDYDHNKATATFWIKIFEWHDPDEMSSTLMNQLENEINTLINIKWGHKY